VTGIRVTRISGQFGSRQHRFPMAREDCHTVPVLLTAPDRFVSRTLNLYDGELRVRCLELLQADDIRLGGAQPVQQVRQAALNVVDVERGNLHAHKIAESNLCLERRASRLAYTGRYSHGWFIGLCGIYHLMSIQSANNSLKCLRSAECHYL